MFLCFVFKVYLGVIICCFTLNLYSIEFTPHKQQNMSNRSIENLLVTGRGIYNGALYKFKKRHFQIQYDFRILYAYNACNIHVTLMMHW